ncbi:MAG TPA: M23 family metallopeptidase [Vicinamibacterales bacterium]|nr:M23 family metallopeptidase [Vicinamibacterales bacterium]
MTRGILRATALAFLAGVITTVVVVSGLADFASRPPDFVGDHDDDETPMAAVPARLDREPPPVSPPAKPPVGTPPAIGSDPVDDLRSRDLAIPVREIRRDQLRSSFHERRGAARQHEAMDILAPRHTPVLAVEDGTIAKLFHSKAGGITIYQFDPTSAYAYYYAHLERYAEELHEGDAVSRGQVIGYVGTSGNAPPNTPHLHFAIFKLTSDKRWWQGTPIDPFDVWR